MRKKSEKENLTIYWVKCVNQSEYMSSLLCLFLIHFLSPFWFLFFPSFCGLGFFWFDLVWFVVFVLFICVNFCEFLCV